LLSPSPLPNINTKLSCYTKDMHPVEYFRRNSSLAALVLSSCVSVGILLVHVISTHSFIYWYLGWNLLLAWLPLLFVVLLRKSLVQHPWLAWSPMVWTVLWLAFLPNSFYIVSDLLHLQSVSTTNLLYDTVMMVSFMLNGLVLGYISLYQVHQELKKRLSINWTNTLISLSLLVCSFAIYLGRDLRWSSWDLIVSPQGILFDISNQIIDPLRHLQAFTTTLMFFVLIGTFYLVICSIVNNLLASRAGQINSSKY
jgi:uncharacterized membrane protein